METNFDEMLDLVDEHDHVIGQEKRSVIYSLKRKNFRVVNAFVRDERGYLWIPRRSQHKIIFPLCLDMSIGGHVASGENYDEAFSREALEELNIDVSRVPCVLLGDLSPLKNPISAFMRVYEIQLSEDPDYNKSDFIEGFWILPQDLLDCLAAGEKAKSDLSVLVELFYGSK